MALAPPVIFDNGMARAFALGDLINTQEIQTAIANAAGVTWTVPQAMSPVMIRTGAAGVSDTTPDANTWIQGMISNNFVAAGAITPAGVQPGTTYRVRVLNNNTGTLTIVAGANVTLAGTTTIVTVSFRDYLVTVLNGTPQQLFAANTVNGSAVVTGMSAFQTSQVSPGMNVTGTGVPGATTVLSIQPGVGVTLSANATATNLGIALTFAPRVQLLGMGTGLV